MPGFGPAWSMAYLLHNGPASYSSVARLNRMTGGAVAKASLNRANESQGVDPKLRDLPMGRMKCS